MINVTKKEKLIKKQISWDLSFTGLLIFLLFRIPLTNIIGNEGNGYYFVSFEIFTLFYLIFGFCFHQITYELFRRNLKKYSVNTKNTLFTLILVIGILASFMGACGLFIASNQINGGSAYLSQPAQRFHIGQQCCIEIEIQQMFSPPSAHTSPF